LIHLLAACERDIPVFLAAQEERRRLDLVGMKECVGNATPWFEPDLPWRPDFFIVLNDVLADSVERQRKKMIE
jgi:hypothetical protein